MFPDVGGKSPAELLAEFDRVFSTAKKPTAYRRTNVSEESNPDVVKEEKKVVIGDVTTLLLLPLELDVEKVLNDLGRSLGERYLLILSNLYFRGLFRKRGSEEAVDYLRFHHDNLRRLGGEHYKSKLINYGLNEGHIKKSPKPAIEGYRSHEYRLDRSTFRLQSQQRYLPTTKKAISLRRSDHCEGRNEFISKGPAYRKISESIGDLTFDYAQAIEFVAALPHEKKGWTHRRNRLEGLIIGRSGWSVDEQGRNYTVPVGMPRNLRPFLWFREEPVWSVDIKSCQPLLHVKLYPSDTPEKKTYQSIVEGGRFWEHLNVSAGSPYNLADDDEKSDFKKAAFRQIFYAYAERVLKRPKPKPLADAFKKEFPELWAILNDNKQTDSSSDLATTMQGIEADLVLAAVDALKDRPYPLVTIHDAILTTKEGVADVEAELRANFAAFDVHPRFTVVQVTKT